MAIRWRKTGTGITERIVLVLGSDMSPEDLDDTFNYAAARRTFDGLIRDIENDVQSLPIEGFPTKDSPAAFQQEILKLINLTRDRILQGDADQAARFAFKLGAAVTKLQIKQDWEKVALTGKKQRDALMARTAVRNKDAGRQAAERHKRWCAAANAIRARHPNWKLATIAAGVKKQLNAAAHVRTIARAIKKVDTLA